MRGSEWGSKGGEKAKCWNPRESLGQFTKGDNDLMAWINEYKIDEG